MADKEDSKSFASNGVRVRPPPPAPKKDDLFLKVVLFLLGGVRTRPEPPRKATFESKQMWRGEVLPQVKSSGDDLFALFRRLRPPATGTKKGRPLFEGCPFFARRGENPPRAAAVSLPLKYIFFAARRSFAAGKIFRRRLVRTFSSPTTTRHRSPLI